MIDLYRYWLAKKCQHHWISCLWVILLPIENIHCTTVLVFSHFADELYVVQESLLSVDHHFCII